MNKTILLLIAMTFFAPTCNAQSAAQPDRLVRVTTGYHQVSGWEKPLVDGNPNLAHYHWTPQGGYDQGYLHIRSPQRPQGSVYTKPIHISPDAYIPKTKESQTLANRVSTPDPARRDNLLAGQILPDQRVQAVVAQPPRVATYADYETHGRLVPRAKHHQQDGFANESVSGQLLSRGYRRAM